MGEKGQGGERTEESGKGRDRTGKRGEGGERTVRRENRGKNSEDRGTEVTEDRQEIGQWERGQGENSRDEIGQGKRTGGKDMYKRGHIGGEQDGERAKGREHGGVRT